MKKIISILCCVLIIAGIFSACSSGEKAIDFIYPFSGKLNSYDPQVAATADEFLVCENCFEGLVRCDDNGNILPACAEKWEVREDGLKYTFHLKKGLRWFIYNSVKERMGKDYNPEITANDFVFALRRAADRATESPLYSTISCIRNASAVNEGRASSSELGVVARDNYTLEIYLDFTDDGFLQTLSTAVAMPCNEEFFNKTNGRYGLDLMYTMFNGQFIVTNELEKSYILRRNESYAGPSPAIAKDLTLKIVDDEESLAPKLLSGYYDAAYLRGYELNEIGNNKDIKTVPYSDITWALVINSANGILSNQDARHSLCISLSDVNYDKFRFLTKATGFIPPSCTANGKAYTEQSHNITNAFDGEAAVSLWKEAVKDEKSYSAELTLLAPDTMQEVAKQLLQGMQSSIGAISNVNDKRVSISIKLETLTENELKARVAIKDYDLALYPFRATSASPVSFLQGFSANNITGFYDESFNTQLEAAKNADSSSLIEYCERTERELIESYCYAPLFYESNFYASAKGVSGVHYHAGSGRISFVYADRKS